MYNLIKTRVEGMRLQKQGDHAAAKIVFSKLLADDPNNLQNLHQIIIAYMKTNDFERAITACRKSLKQDPTQVEILLHLGMAFYHCGDIRSCTQNILTAFQIDPSRTDIRDLWKALKSRPYFVVAGGFQGIHAPERQVFMSAVVDILKRKKFHLKILEIGTYAGSSTLTWANAIDKLFKGKCDILCIDAWKNSERTQYSKKVEHALQSNCVYDAFLHNIDLVTERVKVRHIESLSELALPNIKEASFDIIYVDGCHYYKEVRADILESKRIISDGGIICGDDLELTYQEVDTKFAIENQRSDYVKDPKTGKHYHPGVTLAVHESFGDVSVFQGFWLMQRVGSKFCKISFENATGVLPKHFPQEMIKRIKNYFKSSNLLGNLVT